MKKFYLSLAAASLLAAGANGQAYVEKHLLDPLGWPVYYPEQAWLDSICETIEQSDSTLSGTWRNDEKFSLPKYPQGNLALFGGYIWDTSSNQWMVDSNGAEIFFTYVYDANNRVTSMVMRMVPESGEQTFVRTATYTIDGSGKYTHAEYRDSIEGLSFPPASASEEDLSYDGSGRLIERIGPSGIYSGDLIRYTFTWTGNNLTEIILSEDDGSGGWENDEWQTITYDTNDRIIEIIDQYWDDSAWINDEKNEYTYDAQGRLEDDIDYAYDNGWVNDEKTTYHYIGSTNQLSYVDDQVGNGSSWENSVSWEVVYNGAQLAEAFGYLWDGSSYELNAKLHIIWSDSCELPIIPIPLNPPTNLAANVVARAASSVSLTWDDNSNNEDGFTIERSTDGTIFSGITDVAANETSYTDTTDLADGTIYFYRVLAFNNDGTSAPSNTVNATTWATAVQEAVNAPIRVFPNPINETMTISNVPNGSTINVMDITGKSVYSAAIKGGQTTIMTADFENGVYILQVTSDGAVASRKLVVSH